MAHDLNLTVVAEGVEDYESLLGLDDIGCDIAQGFCISRPLGAEDFRTFLEQWSWAGMNKPRRATS